MRRREDSGAARVGILGAITSNERRKSSSRGGGGHPDAPHINHSHDEFMLCYAPTTPLEVSRDLGVFDDLTACVIIKSINNCDSSVQP